MSGTKKERVLEYSNHLSEILLCFCAPPLTEGSGKRLDYEQHICFKFWLRVSRLRLNYQNNLSGEEGIMEPDHSSNGK